MNISSLTVPKYRDLHAAGDDTTLILPGLLGVFDGASTGTVSGTAESPGKAASTVAARAVADLMLTGEFMSALAEQICALIRQRIAMCEARFSGSAQPATTVAVVAFDDKALRIFVVGDSGVRINGHAIYRHLKPVDDIWTNARVQAFKILTSRYSDMNAVEELARKCLFSGFAKAVEDNILTSGKIDAIAANILQQFPHDGVKEFLLEGVNTQMARFGNNPDHPLGYSVLCAQKTMMADVIDVTLNIGEVKTVELFSDGYFLLPDEASVSAWEDGLRKVEAADPHKIGEFAGTKGSTSSEFSDDRSVIIAQMR